MFMPSNMMVDINADVLLMGTLLMTLLNQFTPEWYPCEVSGS